MTQESIWTTWERKARNASDESLAYIVKDCREAEVAMRGFNPEREGFYSDQAATFQMEVNRRAERRN